VCVFELRRPQTSTSLGPQSSLEPPEQASHVGCAGLSQEATDTETALVLMTWWKQIQDGKEDRAAFHAAAESVQQKPGYKQVSPPKLV
jgi:hypothetical protein